MKITKQIVEFLLTINGREEQGSFDGHVFTLKGVAGDQLTRLGAAIEREFAVTGEGDAPSASLVKTRGKIVGVRIVEGPLTQLDERVLADASPGEIVTLDDGRRIEIQANGAAVVRRETVETASPAAQSEKPREDEALLRKEEREAAVAEQARKKVDAERTAEADVRARREAERQRQDQEAVDRKAADDANFRREREAAARELAEEQKRQDEEIAAQKAVAKRIADETAARVKAQHEENQRVLAEEQTTREVAEGKARTAKPLAEQAERDRAEARAKEKADLDANMAKAASEDAARKQREEAEKTAIKPALRVVPAPAPSEPKGAAVAPNGLPVPPPPAAILLPTIRFGSCVVAAHELGFRTLDDLYFVLLTAWKASVPAIRAISGTEEELRGRIANNCTLKKLALDGGPAQVDDADDE